MTPKRPNRAPRARSRRLLGGLALTLILLAALTSFALEAVDAPPRALARYIERHAAGHNAVVTHAGAWLASTLERIDRPGEPLMRLQGLRIGAQPLPPRQPRPADASGNIVLVASAIEAVRALQAAQPGDLITFTPGTYHFSGESITLARAGTSASRIVVRADQPGTVFVEFAMTEGFVVTEPYWTFENLNIRGVCARHAGCEHAFHVVSRGSHFEARNNTVTDFNAHFKINGAQGRFPDYGVIEGNTLSNTGIRETDSSVTPIDLVAASGWRISGNSISDFVKAGSDRVSYGAFAKGGGTGNVFEGNLVICEHLLRHAAGQRVGISLGGGGTGEAYCRDARCITEQERGVVRSNLIMACSDDGVYLNRAAASQVRHNTLLDTGGISARYAESGAEVQGNLVDGAIRARDGAVLHGADNVQTSMTRQYLGSHPVRGLYRGFTDMDLAWSTSPPRSAQPDVGGRDLCGSVRSANPTYGAFEDFAPCVLPASAGTQGK
jgi:hypothetical protein